MKTTCLLFLTMSWATLTHGTGYAVPLSPASRLSKLEDSSSGQRGFAAPLCGKPLAFRHSPLPFTPPFGWKAEPSSRTEGVSWRASPRKGKAFPHSGAAKPLVSTRQSSDEQRDHGRASNPNHPPSRPSLTKVIRPKQLPNSRQRSIPGNALHQPGSDKSGGAARSGFIRNETANNALAVRTPSVVRPGASSLDNVRHRSPNPAFVGGSPNSHSTNAGAIDGSRMNRKR